MKKPNGLPHIKFDRFSLIRIVFLVISLNTFLFSHLFSQNYWEKVYTSSGTSSDATISCLANGSGSNLFAGKFVRSGGNPGIILSSDNGATWNIVGLRKFDILSLDYSAKGILYAGTIQNGLYRSTNNGLFWDSLGPSNETISSLLNLQDKEIFVGSYNNGVLKTTNNGISWVNIGLQSSRVNALATDSSGNIFAGTLDGLFILKKNSTTWNKISGINSTINSIVVDSGKNIIVGTEGLGVLLSTNSGNNWNSINNGLTNLFVRAVTVNSFGHIFAGTSEEGVSRSLDYGMSWEKINTGLSENNIKSLLIDYRGYLFAGTYSTGDINKSIKSTSGGIRLKPPTLSYPENGAIDVPSSPSISWQPLVGAESYTVQIADNSAFTGLSLVSYQTTETSRFLGKLQYSTKYYWRVNATNSENVTSAWSEIWSFTTEIPPKVFWQASGGPNKVRSFFSTKKNYIFATTTGEGIWSSANNGRSWSAFYSFNSAVYSLGIDSNNRLYVGIGPGGLIYSTNNGNNWIPTGLWDDDVHSILILPAGDIIAGGVRKIYRSTDNGTNWTNAAVGSGVISSLVLEKTSGNILAGTRGDGVFLSTNNGQSWSNSGLNNNTIINLVFDTKGNLFAATEDSGVYRSTNSGKNWSMIFSIPCNSFNYLTSMAISPNDKLYIGYSEQGVFQSTDNGKSWSNIETGLQSKSVFGLGVDKDGYIYSGTFLSGIFRSVNTAFVSVKKINNNIPEGFSLQQNYPNPFNPNTTIQYSIPKECNVTLDVYDGLGRHVKSLINQRQPAANYSVDLDASKLTSGVYYYSLKAGEFYKTNKFILTK
jgi:ligand-binding sensor domain-containing protein